MSMNYSDFIQAVAKKADASQVETRGIVTAFIDVLTDSLQSSEEVNIPKFGKFETRKREARVAKNPRTGESINVPACHVVKFKPAKKLKDDVNS